MSNLSITTRFIQQLSKNGDSVIPAAAKDTLSNCAITYIYDKKASKEDGKERAIEEFGTEIIWIGGIPALKKLFDKTVYKFFKADPKFDIRNLKKNSNGNFERLEFLVKNTKDLAQKQTLENILKNENIQKLYKKLYLTKFATATSLTLASLAGLIVYKQSTTQKEMEQKIKKKMELANAVNQGIANNQAFGAFNNNSDNSGNVSFKGGSLAQTISNFMYNPLRNMSILDGGITTTRLALARKGERFEVGFKELFQIALIYFLAEPIQKGLENIIGKGFKTPIHNEYQLLSDKNLNEFLTKDGLKNSIDELCALKNSEEVLDYVFKNQDGTLVKMLKISGAVPTLKDKNTINTLAFIDTEAIQNTAKNIDELLCASLKSNDPKKLLSRAKNLKGVSVIANILIGAAAIGIIQPMANIIMRKKRNNGESINPAIKNMETQMEQKFAFKG